MSGEPIIMLDTDLILKQQQDLEEDLTVTRGLDPVVAKCKAWAMMITTALDKGRKLGVF